MKKPVRWEYLSGTYSDLVKPTEIEGTMLNRLGNAGWELINVVVYDVTDDPTSVYYFKRLA